MKINRSKENYERFHRELILLTTDTMNLVNKYSEYFPDRQKRHCKKFNSDMERQILKFNKSYDNKFNTSLCSHLHLEDYNIGSTKRYTKYEMVEDAHKILDLQPVWGDLLFDRNSPLSKAETISNLFDEFTTFKFDYEDLFLKWFPDTYLLWGSGGLIG